MTAQLDTQTLYQTTQPTSKQEIADRRMVSAGQTVREQRMADQLAAQAARLQQQEEALLFLAGLVKGLQNQVQQLMALPAPAAQSVKGEVVQATAIVVGWDPRHNKRTYHIVTAGGALCKFGARCWAEEDGIDLGVDWKALPMGRTPFVKKVTVVYDRDGKKPKVIGLG